MSIYEHIKENIEGRLAIANEDESNLLIKYTKRSGDHLEIGTLWGGTAILAALAKKKSRVKGHVYSVDFMQGGFWVHGDPGANLKTPSHKAILDNIKRFELENRITSIKAKSNPLPINKDVKPTTAFIDGGHSYDECLADWNNIKDLKPDIIIFHDYNTGKHPGINQVVDNIVRKDKQWKEIESSNTMIVFEAVK